MSASGSGSGDGDGYGYGDGDGLGFGSGFGFGFSDGFGFGFGSGYGYGFDGDEIGKISEYSIIHLTPWPYIRVGCECHSVEWWRENWRKVAEKEKIVVSQSEVEELLCRATSFAAAQTGAASQHDRFASYRLRTSHSPNTYGSGFGSGYVYGSGFGFGYGSVDGYGGGFSSGDGSGSDGSEIGNVGEYSILHLTPWPYIRVGCACHSIQWWRENWRKVAEKEGVVVSESQVEEMLCQL